MDVDCFFFGVLSFFCVCGERECQLLFFWAGVWVMDVNNGCEFSFFGVCG